MDKAPKYITEKLWTAELPKELSNSYLESRDQQLPKVIYPDIRVLTANKGTQNDTYYPEESLRGIDDQGTGLISFNRPYPVPILRDHLDTPSADGRYSSEVYGRVYHPAQLHSNGGAKFVRCMATITHPEAIEAILTGRWLTVSLGSKTESVQCSICRAELQEGLCDHLKGKNYETEGNPEKQKCRWVIGPIRAREISFVVSPSDDEAGILSPNLNESIAFKVESSLVIPRLLVGDDKGIFDLATGAQIEESSLFARPVAGKIFGGLSFLGSSVSLKESRVDKKTNLSKRVEPQTVEEATKWMKEDFIGPGKYLLSGWDHDHTVVLDQRGDGTSSPGQMPQTQSMSPGYMYPTNAGAGGGPARGRGMGDGDNGGPTPAPVQDGDQEDHTHEVLGGRVMKAGYPTHSHDMEPAHAALENKMPDTKTPESVKQETSIQLDTDPVTLGLLYHLPEDHPDYKTPDDVDDTNESIKEAKLTYAARKNLDSGAFCGPDRSFPAHDAAHVRNGLARLSQSSLSSEQKAKVHGCLSGRAKKYGIQVGGKEAFAAKLIDTNHHVEFGLYPMPDTFEATEAVLVQVKVMPHTPSEKEGIMSRIAAHCKTILPMSSWQFLFGELTLCEEGDPVSIIINAENYGLLYNLSSATVLSVESKTAEEPKCDPCADTKEADKVDDTKVAAVDAKEDVDDGRIPIVPLPKMDTTPSANPVELGDPASDIVREAMKNLQVKATESDKTARLALAHSTALYMKMLRKPLSRNKTTEQLIEELKIRSADSLQDTLNDLLQEIEANPTGVTQTLPKVEDPTKTEPTATKVVKTTEAAPLVETPEAPKAEPKVAEDTPPSKVRLTPLVEMTGDDDEETFTVLGTLFSELKIAPKK